MSKYCNHCCWHEYCLFSKGLKAIHIDVISFKTNEAHDLLTVLVVPKRTLTFVLRVTCTSIPIKFQFLFILQELTLSLKLHQNRRLLLFSSDTMSLHNNVIEKPISAVSCYIYKIAVTRNTGWKIVSYIYIRYIEQM